MTDAVRVCAVVASPAGGGAPAGTIGALERQTRPLDEVVILPAGDEAPLPGGPVDRATWVWLLDASAVPEPGALEALLEVVERDDGLPFPALLASKVVLGDGSLERASLPVAQIRDPDLTIDSFERRVLAIRVARRGALLVHRSGLEAMRAQWPRLTPFADDLEWTARLLKQRPGLLVPGSVAVRSREGRGARPRLLGLEPARRIRLLLGDAIEFGDKPWFVFRFAEEAMAELRERRLSRG